MPTYNCGRFIEDSIRSVLAQSYTNWELIVVDDCSTDKTAEIVASFKDERIRFMCNEQNMGAAMTRNRALREAKGKYIAFLDADDLWAPEKLEKQIAFMERNNYAFTYHDYIEIDEESKPLGVYVSGKKHVNKFDMYSCCWPGCLTVIYDASVIGPIQIPDLKRNNDLAIWLRVIAKADCYLLPENLAQYRRRRGSITPKGLWNKIGWQYLSYRQGMGMNHFASTLWTFISLFGHSYKKIGYIRKVDLHSQEPSIHPLTGYQEHSDNTTLVSIICPIYNEEQYITTCIESVLKQDLPANEWELLLVDGGSTDNTRELILPYTERYPNIRLLNNPKRTVPYAMNIGILAAKGKYICRIDAHASFPSNYVSTLLHYINQLPDAVNVGAACRTLPRNDSPKAKAISAILSNRFGVGNSNFRLGTKRVTEVDTVPFGFFKREIFDKVGLYNERLDRNQDIELNNRIASHRGKIYLVPDTYCIYYARATYCELAKNNFGNGKWNILTVYFTHNMKSLELRHFIPLLFVLSVITGVTVLLYALLMGAVSLQIARKQQLNFFYVFWAFCVLHFSYGCGSLVAMLQLPFLKR